MQHHRLQDPALESRLPGLFDVMADAAPDDPAIGDAVLGRARRRRARRLAGGVAGTATGMAAAVALAVGGVPALPGFGTGGSSQAAAGQAAAKRVLVGPYELTVLPQGLLPRPRSGEQEAGTRQDQVDKGLITAFVAQEFTEGAREPSAGKSNTARHLTVLATGPAKGSAAAAQRAFTRDIDRERQKLKAGETLVKSTMLGRPAFLLSRTGKRIDLFAGPDAATGQAVNLSGRNLTVAEIRAVAEGLRLVPGAPPIGKSTPTSNRTSAPITPAVVPAAESAWPNLEPKHPPLEVHQAVLNVYRAPADGASRNLQREYQWVQTTSGALRRQFGDDTALLRLEDDDPVYVAQVPKATRGGKKVPASAKGQFIRVLIPLPKGTTRVTESWVRGSQEWLDLSGLGTAHRASADFKP